MILLYSIIRIILPSTCLRSVGRAFSAFFVVVWVVIIVLKVWSCLRSQKLTLEESACHVSSPIAIFQVTGECTYLLKIFRSLSSSRFRWRRKFLDFFGGSSFPDDSGGRSCRYCGHVHDFIAACYH
ncbi:hypothetical protein J3R82DRAFT_1750 [Butyriboletus roseoflavus]|nr:hypothetical protein J3R82DRAFT_1750 [Butyriboletus roseoflavus]